MVGSLAAYSIPLYEQSVVLAMQERIAALEAEEKHNEILQESNRVAHERVAALEQKVNMLESLEVKYIEEIQELHDRIIALRAI